MSKLEELTMSAFDKIKELIALNEKEKNYYLELIPSTLVAKLGYSNKLASEVIDVMLKLDSITNWQYIHLVKEPKDNELTIKYLRDLEPTTKYKSLIKEVYNINKRNKQITGFELLKLKLVPVDSLLDLEPVNLKIMEWLDKVRGMFNEKEINISVDLIKNNPCISVYGLTKEELKQARESYPIGCIQGIEPIWETK